MPGLPLPPPIRVQPAELAATLYRLLGININTDPRIRPNSYAPLARRGAGVTAPIPRQFDRGPDFQSGHNRPDWKSAHGRTSLPTLTI